MIVLRQQKPWITQAVRHFSTQWERLPIAEALSEIFGRGARSINNFKSKVTKILGAQRLQKGWSKRRRARAKVSDEEVAEEVDDDDFVDVRPSKRPRLGD